MLGTAARRAGLIPEGKAGFPLVCPIMPPCLAWGRAIKSTASTVSRQGQSTGCWPARSLGMTTPRRLAIPGRPLNPSR